MRWEAGANRIEKWNYYISHRTEQGTVILIAFYELLKSESMKNWKDRKEGMKNHYHRHPIDSSSFHYALRYMTYTRRTSLHIDKYETITHKNICCSCLAQLTPFPLLLLLRLLPPLLKTNILDDFFGFTLHTTITACWTAMHPSLRLQKDDDDGKVGEYGDEQDKQSSYFPDFVTILCPVFMLKGGRRKITYLFCNQFFISIYNFHHPYLLYVCTSFP